MNTPANIAPLCAVCGGSYIAGLWNGFGYGPHIHIKGVGYWPPLPASASKGTALVRREVMCPPNITPMNPQN